MTKRLSIKRIERARQPGRYADGDGLYLQVGGGGSKSWVFRYERAGREKMLGLGGLNAFTLEEARARARLIRQQLADGIDPLEARNRIHQEQAATEARSMRFADCVQHYYRDHHQRWRSAKEPKEFLGTLRRYAEPVIGDLRADQITTAHIIRLLKADDFWTSKPVTAGRVRGRIEAVLNWAEAHHYRAGDNPANWKRLSAVLPSTGKIKKSEHMRALPYAGLPAFMTGLRVRDGVPCKALEFLILTAARANEVIGARWDEIDETNRLWIVPKERSKTGKEHRVPLSDRALAILEGLPREDGNDHLFIGARARASIGHTAMLKQMKSMGHQVTVHGFRSSFRDWAAEQTAYPNLVVEQALAHSIGNAVQAAYLRSDLLDKRQRLMQSWADFCCSTPQPAAGSNVVPLQQSSI